MGGSTNTVLHLLAIAHEAGVDFTMADIDRLSRKTPCLCKVAPSSSYHVEDVNRAGGIHGDPGGARPRGPARHLRRARRRPDARRGARRPGTCARPRSPTRRARRTAARPAGKPNLVLGSQHSSTTPSWTLDREKGCIRDIAHAYYADGGLAVLYGNIAERGCIVKTAGVDPSIFQFRGPAQGVLLAGGRLRRHPRRERSRRATWW